MDEIAAVLRDGREAQRMGAVQMAPRVRAVLAARRLHAPVPIGDADAIGALDMAYRAPVHALADRGRAQAVQESAVDSAAAPASPSPSK